MKGRISFASHALVVGPVLAAGMLLQAAAAWAGTSAADAYRTECGDCHLAFPPSLLLPADWATVLANLDRHYGVDATLDDASRAVVARQLRADVAAAPGNAVRAALHGLPAVNIGGASRRIVVNVDPKESAADRISAADFQAAITRLKAAAVQEVRADVAEHENRQHDPAVAI